MDLSGAAAFAEDTQANAQFSGESHGRGRLDAVVLGPFSVEMWAWRSTRGRLSAADRHVTAAIAKQVKYLGIDRLDKQMRNILYYGSAGGQSRFGWLADSLHSDPDSDWLD